MKTKNIILLLLLLAAATLNTLQAQEDRNRGIIQSALYGLEYEVRAGFNIGGTSPLPLPKEIRALTGYSPNINIAIGSVFFLVGLAAFGIGAVLVTRYPELLG